MSMRICIFGASITYGFYDKAGGGYVQRIRHILENDHDYDGQVFNLGISGANTEDLLRRFDVEAAARRPQKIVISLSTNDTQFLVNENRLIIPLENYRKNVAELIKKARKYTEEIIIVGITAVDDDLVNPMSWAKEKALMNEKIEKYNNVAREICQKERVKFIDLYPDMIKIDYKEMLDDGLHPNAQGHKWMAERIIKELDL